MRFVAVLGLVAFTFACSSQQSAKNGAALKIDSGWFVGEAGAEDNTVPGVLWLGMCTSTAVSDNTLLFAGHCVKQRSSDGRIGDQICIQSGTLSKDACAEQVWVPPSWAQREDFRQDIAVAIFKRGTFKRYFEINEGSLRVGEKVFLTGYSQANNLSPDKGSKRWGYSSVQEFDEDNAIITHYGNSGNAVAVSPGDSGGPMFTESCKVTGVASRMDEGFSPKIGLHTNVNDKENLDWLKSLRAKGAEFCGLSDAKGEFCDTANRAEPRKVSESGRQPTFPCTEKGTDGGRTNQDAASDIFLAFEDFTDVLHISVPAAATKIYLCFDKAPAACSTEEIAVGSDRTLSGRSVFKTSAALALGTSTSKRVAVVAKDSAGKNVAALAADIKKK